MHLHGRRTLPFGLALALLARVGTAQTTSEHHLPALGLTVTDVRQVEADGRVSRSTRLADGTPVDLDALRREDHALALARRSGLSPALTAALQGLAPHDRLEVALWLHAPDHDPGADLRRRCARHLRELSGEALAQAIRDERHVVLQAAKEALRLPRRALAARIEAAGGTVLAGAEAWPLVLARVDAATARQLALDPAVDVADVLQPEWFPEGEIAQGTLRTPTTWAQGIQLTNQVNVLINDTGQVQLDNPWLPQIVPLNVAPEALHATGVAGNIACHHPDHLASCFSLQRLYSGAGYGDATAPALWDLAISAGVDFGNCSWWNGQKGSVAFLDRFFDYTIRHFGVMMFKSAGNQGGTLQPYTTTPGNGFNMISSGSYSDEDTVAWDDDGMAASSSSWNPVQGHEKPELVSPGTCVTTTGTGANGLQNCFGGTSSASPLTCGVAALLAAGEPSLLAEMTSLKAVLMASAWHNLEGDPLLSDADGVGGVDAAAAWALVRDHHWYSAEVHAQDFPGGVHNVPLHLLAGEDVRIVALWFGEASSSYASDVLSMDIDLVVLAPGGQVVASSTSASNPFEIAGFRAEQGGTYVVRLTLQRFQGTSEPLALAWSTRSDTATASTGLAPGSAPFAAGETPTLRFAEPYEGAGRGYVAWAALSGPESMPLGASGYTVPAGFDYLAKYSVLLPGFIGTLDAAGQALASFHVPDVPAAVGLALHFGLVVFPRGAGGDLVQTVGLPASFVIAP